MKTAAVAAVAAVPAKAQVSTLTIGGAIAVGDKVSLTVTGTRLETTSLPIALAAGTSYYVRALMKEGGGGDNLAVAWIKSGEAAPANDALPIPGSVLTPANSINYTYAGFVNNEGTSALISLPSGSIDASPTTSAGDVDITIAGADAANYDVTHVNGKLTIAPAALTISAVNKEVLETVAVPEFTYTVSGFLNGEDSSVVTGVPSLQIDLTKPGDSVTPTSSNSPGGEQSANAIDNNSGTKYLNFDKVDTGLTITTGGGVVTGLGLTSANDAPDRDPANFILSGSNDGGTTFTEIATGTVPSFSARFERQQVTFANAVDYTTYQLIFPTTVGPSTCCMQIAEIELLGTAAALPPGDYTITPSGAVATNYAVNYVNGNLKVNTLAKPKVTSLVVSNKAPSVGAKVTMTATATGDLITYEWYSGRDLIQGETSNTLVVEDIGLDQSGRYSVCRRQELKG